MTSRIEDGVKLSTLGKSEFPSQTENRRQWILDTIRANQDSVVLILEAVIDGDYSKAKEELGYMYGMDRDALLKPGGILTDEQIERLTQ